MNVPVIVIDGVTKLPPAIALDISTAELQGLYTADYFLQDGTSYFERVLARWMRCRSHRAALTTSTAARSCTTTTRQPAAHLRGGFRVLRPGGRLLVVNETLKTLRDPVGVHAEAVAHFEGYEHAYWALRYRWEAIAGRLLDRVIEPVLPLVLRRCRRRRPPVPVLASRPWAPAAGEPSRARAYLTWLNHVWGGVSLNMSPRSRTGSWRADGAGPAQRVASMLAAGAAMQFARALRRRRLAAAAAHARQAERAPWSRRAPGLRGSRRRAARSG